MEEALRTMLLANAGVTAIAGTNINWGEHPQGVATPFIVLTLIDDAEGLYLDADEGSDGLSIGRVQVDCYGTSYRTAKRLARAVRAAAHGYRGGSFSGIFEVASRDFREGGSNEADRPFRVSVDLLTHWRE